MRVGKRLEKILSLLNNKVGVIADIGTDHGILAFRILTDLKADKVIATDISEPSLDKARELKDRYGFGNKFLCKVGDGLKPLKDEKKIDVVIIAGMGGIEIVKILNQKPSNLEIGSFIFQPMQDAEILREFLISSGYNISVDETVKDRDKFYSTIKCDGVIAPKTASIEEIVVGKTDRQRLGNDFRQWLEMEITKQESREKFLSEEKKARLNVLKKLKLENEEKNNI